MLHRDLPTFIFLQPKRDASGMIKCWLSAPSCRKQKLCHQRVRQQPVTLRKGLTVLLAWAASPILLDGDKRLMISIHIQDGTVPFTDLCPHVEKLHSPATCCIRSQQR